MSAILAPLRLLARTGHTISGTAAVEFALAATLVMILLCPIVDLGIAFFQQLQVQNAAQAGAQYAATHGWDSTAIQNAVTSSSALAVSASPAPSQGCGCPNGTSFTAATCGGSCTGGLSSGTYVTVSAQSTYTPLLPYSFFGTSTTLAATSVVRIQ